MLLCNSRQQRQTTNNNDDNNKSNVCGCKNYARKSKKTSLLLNPYYKFFALFDAFVSSSVLVFLFSEIFLAATAASSSTGQFFSGVPTSVLVKLLETKFCYFCSFLFFSFFFSQYLLLYLLAIGVSLPLLSSLSSSFLRFFLTFLFILLSRFFLLLKNK